jgi:hypothetical protein
MPALIKVCGNQYLSTPQSILSQVTPPCESVTIARLRAHHAVELACTGFLSLPYY